MQHTAQIHNPLLYVGLNNRSKAGYLKALKDEPNKNVDLTKLIEQFEKSYNISRFILFSKSRNSELANIRFIFAYRAYTIEKATFKCIGKFMNRDHSSVIYAVDQYRNLFETDKAFRNLTYKLK